MKKKYFIVILFLFFNIHFLSSMEPFVKIPKTIRGEAWRKPTQQGYRYKSETIGKHDIGDARKIIVFSYGSLVNQRKSPVYKNKLKAGQFIETDIKVPVSLTRLAGAETSKRRLTVIIDNESNNERNLWAAFSKFTFLPNALNNLAAREGSSLKSKTMYQNGYNLSSIFYIKKLFHNQSKGYGEIDIKGMPGWVVHIDESAEELQKLSPNILKEMASLAEQNDADAAIWASFPPNISSQEAKKKLKKDTRLRRNTDTYLATLPEPKWNLEE